jgi:hypothetical protein
MTSTRKMEANKRNASRSTGPRSPGGKLRSANNARRHGLAIPVDHDADAATKIQELAAALAGGSQDLGRTEQARVIAECYFDLRRIREARNEIFSAAGEFHDLTYEDIKTTICAIDKINRYERRAVSKRKRGLRRLAGDEAPSTLTL